MAFRWGCALFAFALGDLLIYYGTAMGFACPGCGLRDPGVWLYTMLPWLGGAVFLGVAGWFYHSAARPMHGVLVSIILTLLLGIGALFVLFIAFAVIASGLRH
jgi:hypothetical protein